jgi:hypothetical protein
MAFQIRDLVSDVGLEGEGFLYAECTHPSCEKSSDDGNGDGDGGDKGGHKGGGPKDDPKHGDKKGPKPKYASDAGLALLRQQLRQSLAQEL